MLVGYTYKHFPPVWLKLQRAVWGNEKARSHQIGASSALMSPGFFGLLRNLRPAKQAGPDFGRLFTKLGCNRCEKTALPAAGTTVPDFGAK